MDENGKLGGVIKDTDDWKPITAERARDMAQNLKSAVRRARGKGSSKRILKEFPPLPTAGSVTTTPCW